MLQAKVGGQCDTRKDKRPLQPRATPVGHHRGMLIPRSPANTDDLHLRPCPPGACLSECIMLLCVKVCALWVAGTDR